MTVRVFARRSLAKDIDRGRWGRGSCLDFCAEHGIVADIELIRVDEINKAYERMLEGDLKYRFVIDNASLAQLSHESTEMS